MKSLCLTKLFKCWCLTIFAIIVALFATIILAKPAAATGTFDDNADIAEKSWDTDNL